MRAVRQPPRMEAAPPEKPEREEPRPDRLEVVVTVTPPRLRFKARRFAFDTPKLADGASEQAEKLWSSAPKKP
jgi:hypothetical protein